jgi:hypothetical protein
MVGDSELRRESNADARDPPTSSIEVWRFSNVRRRKVARSRSIKRNEFCVLEISNFDESEIFEIRFSRNSDLALHFCLENQYTGELSWVVQTDIVGNSLNERKD